MKLRLDEYYYLLNVDYGWDGIQKYMPEDIANKYIEFRKSHNVKEIEDYIENLYSYIEEIDIRNDIDDIDLEKSYITYRAVIEIKGKYYAFYWYDSYDWYFEDQVDASQDLIEVFPKEVTTTVYTSSKK